jgi:aspartate racemase
MKSIGLIGGMSWESSALYYRIINEETKRRMGGHHNARSVMLTVDFAEADRLMHAGDWDGLGNLLCDAARRLERAGADCVVLCTNTMHKLADRVADAANVPFLHIADATASAILADGHRQVGLIATRFTMEESFYRDRLKTGFNIEAIVPSADSRAEIHRIIFEELCHGVNRPESRDALVRVIEDLRDRGATGVILGCTEIELLISAADSCLPIFPSARLHALAAVDYSISGDPQ